MLTREDEFRLASRYRDDNDVDAARQLVVSHLRLVISVARGYLGYGLPHADLVQEGNIGLMTAVQRFDPTRDLRLVSFAIHLIKAEIHEYVLKNRRMLKTGNDQGAAQTLLQPAQHENQRQRSRLRASRRDRTDS